MAEIVWTESALDDLDEIARYIALDQIAAAQNLVRAVFKRIDLLSQSPHSGRKVPELSPSKYKEVIVGPCRVFYRYSEDVVYILHIMKVERELRKFLLEKRDIAARSSGV